MRRKKKYKKKEKKATTVNTEIPNDLEDDLMPMTNLECFMRSPCGGPWHNAR
jgi:hypothetical protein